MRKIISLFTAVLLLTAALTACGDGKYPESVDSALEEGVDYLDHASTYDGTGLSYDESMWYVNDLTAVPLPDPHV